ncbi:T9SS type A sorting domain-containing protein, partial [Hymenobacter sp. BT770]
TGTIYVKNSTTGCVSAGDAVSLTVNPNPTISTPAIGAICAGSTSASLTYASVSGGANQYKIVWTTGLTSMSDFASLPASPITISGTGSLTAANSPYTGTIYVKNSTTGCVSAGDAVSLTVNALPTTPTVSILQPDLCTNTTASLALKVTNAEYGSVTYTLTQPNVALSSTNPKSITTSATGTGTPLVVFENLVPGGGYSVTATNNAHCSSGTAACPTTANLTAPSNQSMDMAQPLKRSIQTEAYPNPTGRDATINFSVPKSGRVVVEVYNAIGARVATLFDGEVKAGENRSVTLKGTSLQSGTYTYRVIANGSTKSNRISLIK